MYVCYIYGVLYSIYNNDYKNISLNILYVQ